MESYIPSPDLPPFLEGVADSIDDLFHEITLAIDMGAETIHVQWHPIYRYPQSCYVDVSLEIAVRYFKVSEFVSRVFAISVLFSPVASPCLPKQEAGCSIPGPLWHSQDC